MNTIGKNIAELRKSKGMTQEALGSVIGVSPQTVSKWENDTNMPDITLLPVIADVFGVTVDELFGRKTKRGFGYVSEPLKVCSESLLDSMFAYMYDDNSGDVFEESLQKYKKALTDHKNERTAVICKEGIIYYRDRIGGLILKKPEIKWAGLLEDRQNYSLLELMADSDFRSVLSEIIKTGKTFFTIPSMSNRCNIKDKETLEKNLDKSRLFSRKAVETEDGKVVVYELTQGNRLFLIFAVLVFASEYEKFEDIYRGYMCDGYYYFD